MAFVKRMASDFFRVIIYSTVAGGVSFVGSYLNIMLQNKLR